MKTNLRNLLTLLFLPLFIVMISPCQSYRITVDAYAEECFYDRLHEGSKFSLIYEVIEGGFLDIDVTITNPKGEELFSRQADSGSHLTFAVTEPGPYNYCFSNKMSTVTPKEVKFTVEIGGPDKAMTDFGDYTSKEAEEIEPEKLEGMIRELRHAILGIHHDQEFMEARDKVHLKISESTNLKITLWVFFEFFLIAVVSLSQVMYIKRFFEIRRIV